MMMYQKNKILEEYMEKCPDCNTIGFRPACPTCNGTKKVLIRIYMYTDPVETTEEEVTAKDLAQKDEIITDADDWEEEDDEDYDEEFWGSDDDGEFWEEVMKVKNKMNDDEKEWITI